MDLDRFNPYLVLLSGASICVVVCMVMAMRVVSFSSSLRHDHHIRVSRDNLASLSHKLGEFAGIEDR